MRNRERNKNQKALTKLIRAINKNIYDDDLWQGRFYVMQRRTLWIEFPSLIQNKDAQGILFVQVRCYDKETGYYKDYVFEYAPWLTLPHSELWRKINDFIVKDLGVWELSPRIQEKDYRNIPYVQNDLREDNFYTQYIEKNALP